MAYIAAESRYDSMIYNRVGTSGLKLPAVSLGLWQNFGGSFVFENARAMLHRAFDLGITHIDLANNYGPPPGSAEENFGRLMATDFAEYRHELVISTKAGYRMQPGPYGEWGSRKYLLGSLDASLKRMGLDYVDIFYSHRFDPDTPLEETMGALASAVQQGKAIYVGISSYSAAMTKKAVGILADLGVPCLIHQPSYSMFNRWIEPDLLPALETHGVGCIVFSPLAQGLLTTKYLGGVPNDSRLAVGKRTGKQSFQEGFIDEQTLIKVRALNDIAQARGQSLAQMALAWCLRKSQVTSVLIGASRPEQIDENVAALDNLSFSEAELAAIDQHATDSGINIWAASSEAA
ncbi:MAG: L-glyceraldehyde 3-phosphate reductase [Deinococcota bacterium]